MNANTSTAQAQRPLADTRWRLDPSASTAEFRVPHFWGLVTVKGHFERLDGYLELDDREQRQMTLTIDAASLHTGIKQRDKHLRASDFFDTDSHPEVRFRSTRVERYRRQPDPRRGRARSRRRAPGDDPRADDPPDRRSAGDRRDHDGRSATARDDVEPTGNDPVPGDRHRPCQPAAPVMTVMISPQPVTALTVTRRTAGREYQLRAEDGRLCASLRVGWPVRRGEISIEQDSWQVRRHIRGQVSAGDEDQPLVRLSRDTSVVPGPEPDASWAITRNRGAISGHAHPRQRDHRDTPARPERAPICDRAHRRLGTS